MRLEGMHFDLVVMTADRNMQVALQGVLSRPKALKIRRIRVEFLVHPHRDPGVLNSSHELLRGYLTRSEYALVVFDREGCGKLVPDRAQLECAVEENLKRAGWSTRAAAIAIDPELEAWVWSGSPHLASCLGWSSTRQSLDSWLWQNGYLLTGKNKPDRPKEALEAALRLVKKPRSSAIYKMIAENVSLDRCTDLAFEKLRTVLRRWFPP